jgi:hypothetical protein
MLVQRRSSQLPLAVQCACAGVKVEIEGGVVAASVSLWIDCRRKSKGGEDGRDVGEKRRTERGKEYLSLSPTNSIG